MAETSFQRYHDRKAPMLYALIDLTIPGFLLYIIQNSIGSTGWGRAYFTMAILSGIFFFLATAIQGGYSRYSERSISKKLEITFKTWFINVFILLAITYFYSVSIKFNRLIMSIWVILTPITVILLKTFISSTHRKLSKLKIKVSILGRHYNFNQFELNMLEKQNIELKYIDLEDISEEHFETLSRKSDYLLLNLETPATSKLIKELTHLDMKGIRIIMLHHFMEVFLRKCYIPYEQEDLSYLEKIHHYKPLDYLIKRIIDWLAVISLTILTSPILIWAILKIKKESPGPVIFSQPRISIGNKEKVLYKFRSMHMDAEAQGAQFATENDPRAYQFGAFMRKTRIDELPQLWNVARGDLHFIGPRPERLVFTTKLEEEIPYYNERHLVRPGITGWAQVLYPYGANTEDARQKLMYDLYYIKHWSIWLEMEALIRTVGVVLGKKGL